MKKIIILIFTFLFCYNAKSQQTKLSINASIGAPHYGISSINKEPMASFSILFHDQTVGIWFTGVGFVYNTGFKYKVDTLTFIYNLPVAEIKFGFNIPDWNKYICGPVIMFNFGVGFKSEGDAYPNTPLQFAISLQQNANIPMEFLDNLQFGIFARGTLGTFLYKDLNLDSAKNLKNNYFGTIEAGLRIYIVDSGKSKRR